LIEVAYRQLARDRAVADPDWPVIFL